MDAITEIGAFYRGFFLTEPEGNNQFSFRKRKQKQIYVAPLRPGEISDLAVGEHIAFSEVEGGQEVNRKGLRQFLYLNRSGKRFFIFDNHNHAFFFWLFALQKAWLKKGFPLLHVDQHTDMRKPESWFDWKKFETSGLEYAFHYTNYDLNVGNFIQPALKAGIFSRADIVDSSFAFQKTYPPPYVLDIDIDIFSPEMDYIDFDEKLERIREYIAAANVITIATSPFFIDQKNAIDIIHRLLGKG